MANLKKNKSIVSIIMGSQSDWVLLKNTAKILKLLKINYTTNIISAHRTPKRLYEFASTAHINNIKIIIINTLYYKERNKYIFQIYK